MPDPAQPTTVLYQQTRPRLSRTAVRALANGLSRQVAGGRPFSCLVARPEALRRLNRDFRGKDESTDVLSFPAAAPSGHLGDVAISIEHARRQARALGHTLEEEIGVLMLHGVLHLMGLDHETDNGAMRRTETRWRRKLGLPAALTERAHSPEERR